MTRVFPEIPAPVVSSLAEGGIAVPWKFLKEKDLSHWENRNDMILEPLANYEHLWSVFHYLIFHLKNYHPDFCICHSIDDHCPLWQSIIIQSYQLGFLTS